MTKYYHNQDFFKVPNNINSYWAGFIAADGCLLSRGDCVEVSLQERDREHLEKLKQAIHFNGPIIFSSNAGSFYSTQGRVRLVIYQAQEIICDLKQNFSLSERKSLTLKPPISLNKDCALSYIAGYIDGDGFINLDKQKLRIGVMGTIDMMCWICNIFDVLFPSSKKIFAKPRLVRGIYNYMIVRRRAFNFANYILSLNLPLLQRKWDKVQLCEYS